MTKLNSQTKMTISNLVFEAPVSVLTENSLATNRNECLGFIHRTKKCAVSVHQIRPSISVVSPTKLQRKHKADCFFMTKKSD